MQKLTIYKIYLYQGLSQYYQFYFILFYNSNGSCNIIYEENVLKDLLKTNKSIAVINKLIN